MASSDGSSTFAVSCASGYPISWMMHPIIDWHIRYQKRIDTHKATNVVPILIRKRAPLMMGVDPTRTAKVMFGYEGLPAS